MPFICSPNEHRLQNMLLEVNSYLKHLNICDLSFLVCLASFDQILNQKEEKKTK